MRQGFFIVFLYLIPTFSNCQKQTNLLYQAYHSKSIKELHRFYENWESEISPMSDSNLNKCNDTIRNIYHVFQIFYNPKDIKRSGGSEFGNEIYSHVQFLLTQDLIVFGFADSLDKDRLVKDRIYQFAKGGKRKIDSLLTQYRSDSAEFESEFLEWPTAKANDTLRGFRPKLSIPGVKILPLVSSYDILLNQFLANDHYNLGEGNIMTPAKSKGESNKRKIFLENYIKIWYGHWGGYWQLYSYPYVSKIIFDHRFEHALIYFTMIYEGGYAYLKKVNGNWTLIQARRTWIE
jgi:hypothetical protein